MSVRPPVRPHGTTLLSLDGISQNFRSVFFENLSGKFKFHYNVKRMTALYMKTKVCWILLGTRNVSDKSCRENPNTLFVFSNFFFFSGNHAIHEMWKNEVLWDRSDENMTHAHWMLDTKATNTHSQYVTLIALPLQSLHKPVSTLRYTYSTLQPVTLCYATRTAHCSLSRCVTLHVQHTAACHVVLRSFNWPSAWSVITSINKQWITACLMTLPVSLPYGSENWSLTLREKHRVRVLEKKVLRETRGPKTGQVTGEWRRLHCEELYDLYSTNQEEMGRKCSTYAWEKMYMQSCGGKA